MTAIEYQDVTTSLQKVVEDCTETVIPINIAGSIPVVLTGARKIDFNWF